MKTLLTGNEAIARGAYEAGVHIATGYPGTPSTEILESLGQYKEVRTDWAPNEKVAFEEAAGASFAGARAMVTMKHVGVNVAADPLFTVAYEGVNGGLVLISADEPGMHSSQNEQDNRLYANHSKIAMLEPSDSQECKDMMKAAFEISETFDTVVMIRMTTRVCHSKSPVELGERVEVARRPYEKNIRKNVMLPAFSRPKHVEMETVRLPKLQEASNASPFNAIEYHDKSIGIIANGIAYQHAKEVFGEGASYLKLGFTFPMPEEMIREFAANVDVLYVIEENEPFIENKVKTMGIACTGKEIIPICGELSPALLKEIFFDEKQPEQPAIEQEIPNRPPTLCAGCPHRGIFYEVMKYKDKIVTTTDIGCYTLGASAPLNVGDICICMGAGFTAGVGFSRAQEVTEGPKKKVFGFMGDSTFFHSGMTGLVDIVYSDADMVAVILDNSITAMTGHQDNPGTGKTLQREITSKVSIRGIVEAMGFVHGENFAIIDPYNLKDTAKIVKEAYNHTGPYVILVERECVLIKEIQKQRAHMRCEVDPEVCRSCKKCLRLGCPSVQFLADKAIIEDRMTIDSTQCTGCTMCLQVCPFGAISYKEV